LVVFFKVLLLLCFFLLLWFIPYLPLHRSLGPKLTSLPRTRLPPSGRSERELIIEELVDTERIYNRELDVISKVGAFSPALGLTISFRSG